MGQFYQITLYYEKKNKQVHKTTFYDSLKIILFSVAETANIRNDVLIMAKALHVIFSEDLTKMTRAGNALADYKEIITKSKFLHYFPPLDFNVDKDLRKAYRGGFTYLNPIYKEKDVGTGVVLDVNSLYPSVMYEKKLPFR